jgi:hypothetical protein
LRIYADGLMALVEKSGVPEKFNATVTFAYMSRDRREDAV